MYVQKHNFQELSNILLNKFTDIDMDKFAIAIGNVQKSESNLHFFILIYYFFLV